MKYPDFLEDCALATQWMHERAGALGCDPGRLFLMGHCAGAYNTAMLALDHRGLAFRPAGWIGLAGPYDFLPSTNPAVQPVFNHPDYPPGSQPIEFADAQAPRTFLGAAPQDPVVDPERNTRQLAAKLRGFGVATTLRLYPGTSHMTLIGAFATPLRWLAPLLDDVVRFITAADGPDPSAFSRNGANPTQAQSNEYEYNRSTALSLPLCARTESRRDSAYCMRSRLKRPRTPCS